MAGFISALEILTKQKLLCMFLHTSKTKSKSANLLRSTWHDADVQGQLYNNYTQVYYSLRLLGMIAS